MSCSTIQMEEHIEDEHIQDTREEIDLFQEELEAELENNERKKRDNIIQKMKERMVRHKERMKNGHKRRKIADENKELTPYLSQIETLPDEVLKHIFELLDLRDLGIVVRVSKRFLTIGEDELLWKNLYLQTWKETSANSPPPISTTTSNSSPETSPISNYLYRDLIDGKSIMWKVSFRKRFQKELYAKRRGQLIEKFKSLQAMECKYCNAKTAEIVETTNNSSLFLVSNQTPRYTIVVHCKNCNRRYSEGRGQEGDAIW